MVKCDGTQGDMAHCDTMQDGMMLKDRMAK